MDKSLAICQVCMTATEYSFSTTNLKTHLVRWHGENYAGEEEPVDANVSNVTASTSKTRKTPTSWLLKTFSSHNSACLF